MAMSAGDRHHLGDGDPVETVHEVDEIHEPDAAEDEKSLLHHEGNGIGQHPHAARRSRRPRPRTICRRSRRLAGRGRMSSTAPTTPERSRPPRRSTKGPKEVRRGRSENRECERHGHQRGADNRDASALRGRDPVARTGVRARQRVANEERLRGRRSGSPQQTCTPASQRSPYGQQLEIVPIISSRPVILAVPFDEASDAVLQRGRGREAHVAAQVASRRRGSRARRRAVAARPRGWPSSPARPRSGRSGGSRSSGLSLPML